MFPKDFEPLILAIQDLANAIRAQSTPPPGLFGGGEGGGVNNGNASVSHTLEQPPLSPTPNVSQQDKKTHLFVLLERRDLPKHVYRLIAECREELNGHLAKPITFAKTIEWLNTFDSISRGNYLDWAYRECGGE